MTLRIALDFDDTYTRNPPMWDEVIALMQGWQTRVYVVTARGHPVDQLHEKYEDNFDRMGVPIIYCDGQSKKEVTTKHGHHIDIWIDDHPEGVTLGSAYTPEMLVHWRAKDVHGRKTP